MYEVYVGEAYLREKITQRESQVSVFLSYISNAYNHGSCMFLRISNKFFRLKQIPDVSILILRVYWREEQFWQN